MPRGSKASRRHPGQRFQDQLRGLTVMRPVFSDNSTSALLVEIVKSFETLHPKNYLGRTAIQKLAYFCQVLGTPLPCSFEIYNYGPYSDELKFTIDSLLADEILIDASQQPGKYSNYKIAASRVDFSSEVQAIAASNRRTIQSVVEAFGGFDPSQLELIATLHFIAQKHTHINGRVRKESVIDEFERIKKDKFNRSDVEDWYDSLAQANLI